MLDFEVRIIIKFRFIVSEDLLLNEGVVPLLWITSYTTLLNI